MSTKIKKKIYLAHPISLLSADEVFTYFDSMKTKLSDYFDVLSPMCGKEQLRTEKEFRKEGYGDPITKNHAIFGRDTWMVNQSDIVLCDFTGSTIPSIGCCMELAIASWEHKHTVVVMDEENIHNHAFINEAADIIFDNTEDAIDYLIQIA